MGRVEPPFPSCSTTEVESPDAGTLTDSFRAAAPSTDLAAVGVRARVRRAMFDVTEPPTHVNRFVIREELGAGGMGTVYAASDPSLRRDVALKVLRRSTGSPLARRRMLREAQAMARLCHPNVLPIYEVGEAHGQPFIAMALVRGPTLRAWSDAQPRSWRAIVQTFVQAADGLIAAHQAGIVHRDFKPENVLIEEQGDTLRVYVADFGIAASRPDPSPTSRMTEPGIVDDEVTQASRIVGTPAYMAPEQLFGEPASRKSDQFAFCVALYEALCGIRPFAPARLTSLLDGVPIQRERSVRRPKIPRRLWRAIARGLEQDPDARHPSMEALRAELAASLRTSVTRRAAIGWALAGALAGGSMVASLAAWL